MSGVFRFKQFDVDQSGCAMKINTDGVLIGALAGHGCVNSILDIGTGTGVIALMLAQRFAGANIDAVEIDETAAATAGRNFQSSAFSKRINIFHESVQAFFSHNAGLRYDLIVSNPPFHIHSLKSLEERKKLARHADESFFEELLSGVVDHLAEQGRCWLILPLQTAELVRTLIADKGLFANKIIKVKSYPDSDPHREIIVLAKGLENRVTSDFVIYQERNEYSPQYVDTLKDFFTIF